MRGADYADLLPRVAEIVGDVRDRGDAALRDWAEKLDGAVPIALRVPPEEIANAELDEATLAAVRELARTVREFHELQRPDGFTHAPFPGIETERRWLPLESVGVYVPGGKTPLPSSLVMTVVPAQVAGVERIAVATPKPVPAILATARELGVTEIYAIGGAQAIAALAYGTETVQRVDKIVGPGQSWTTAAKLLVSSFVGIDLPAGPSEVLIVADASADPALVAADLLAQAEHGPGSESILVTPDEALADAVLALVGAAEQVQTRLVASLEDALAFANEYAPEHLQLMGEEAEALLPRVRHAGAIFLGAASAVLGDYAVGTNHVQPTGGLARARGGLGLEDFLKPIEIVRANAEGLEHVRPIVEALSRIEGLPLHGAAVEARFR
ncbi:MAG: histidinol dehydrogenase [Gaiellaceae bacterium]|nr:histidinol dehydrogenase [Gaiellaceae bacterium]